MKEIIEAYIVSISNQAEIKSIALEEDLLGGGYLDSMGMMRLVKFVEDSFEISIGPKDLTIDNFITIEAIIKFIGVKKTAVSQN